MKKFQTIKMNENDLLGNIRTVEIDVETVYFKNINEEPFLLFKSINEQLRWFIQLNDTIYEVFSVKERDRGFYFSKNKISYMICNNQDKDFKVEIPKFRELKDFL
jgi:hypothetical protein